MASGAWMSRLLLLGIGRPTSGAVFRSCGTGSSKYDSVYQGSWNTKENECPVCGRGFFEVSMLNWHMSNEHVYDLTKLLERNPLETYKKIFGADRVKRVDERELRFQDGLVVCMPGHPNKSPGTWYSFVSDVGGGPIKAIRFADSDLTYAQAVRKGMDMVGVSGVEDIRKLLKGVPSTVYGGAAVESVRLSSQRIDAMRRAEVAQSLWDASTSLKGTPAETYLTETRKIPAEAIGSLAFRFLGASAAYVDLDVVGVKVRKANAVPALVVPVEDAKGKVTAVQRVFLTGKKRNKFSRGVVKDAAGIVMRGAPFMTNVYVVEGPETGASVAAVVRPTSHVLASLSLGNLGNMAGAVLARNPRKVVVAADNDAGKTAAVKAFEKNFRQLRDALHKQRPGLKVVAAVPDLPPDSSKADWNDVLVIKGIDALRREFAAKCEK